MKNKNPLLFRDKDCSWKVYENECRLYYDVLLFMFYNFPRGYVEPAIFFKMFYEIEWMQAIYVCEYVGLSPHRPVLINYTAEGSEKKERNSEIESLFSYLHKVTGTTLKKDYLLQALTDFDYFVEFKKQLENGNSKR